MKLTRKSSMFRRAVIEMSKEEYKVYKFGHLQGFWDGMICGVALSIAVILLIKLLGL